MSLSTVRPAPTSSFVHHHPPHPGSSTFSQPLNTFIALALALNRAAAGNHASHLCDNRHCFNPAHIAKQSVATNNSRACLGTLQCAVVMLSYASTSCGWGPRDQAS
ncbi:hypothetical protein BDW59DRAFT_163531 [Aspergillus cavernicola]|uniref:Zinc-binding loop region of homing endonuclease domain-containing protein n=1 Tax=Aspergillus cavernicola TaxID=176166 RepID=A0ABR4I6A6_9EURO